MVPVAPAFAVLDRPQDRACGADGPARRRPRDPRAAGLPLRPRQRLELARAQQHEQLAARALRPHGRDATLLEVDPGAGEIVDDLRERRLVADREDAGLGAVPVQQLERVVATEAVGQRVVRERLDVERPAGEPRGVERAQLRARVAGVELDPEPRQPLPSGDRLALAAGRQLAVGVGLGLVGNGFSVTKKPELRRHGGVTIPARPCSSKRQ